MHYSFPGKLTYDCSKYIIMQLVVIYLENGDNWHCGVSKYLPKNGLAPKYIHADLVKGSLAPSLITLQNRIAKFREAEERESFEFDPESGSSAAATSEENIDRVHHKVRNDCRLNITQLTKAISISHEIDESILQNELSITNVGATFSDT